MEGRYLADWMIDPKNLEIKIHEDSQKIIYTNINQISKWNSC
jgi:hypothetical protein